MDELFAGERGEFALLALDCCSRLRLPSDEAPAPSAAAAADEEDCAPFRAEFTGFAAAEEGGEAGESESCTSSSSAFNSRAPVRSKCIRQSHQRICACRVKEPQMLLKTKRNSCQCSTAA